MASSKLLAVPIVAFGVLSSLGLVSQAANRSIVIPLKCSKGPSDQKHTTMVKAPATAEQGTEYMLRIDGVNSDKVSHFGLNFIYDMTYEYLIPKDATLVPGSLRVVPETGSENVRSKARVATRGRSVSMVLPGHVKDGSTYTPPSLELKLKVTGASGTSLKHEFAAYRVTANAFMVGDVKAVCVPAPNPFPIATVKVAAAGTNTN